jgi:hypothetical protein
MLANCSSDNQQFCLPPVELDNVCNGLTAVDDFDHFQPGFGNLFYRAGKQPTTLIEENDAVVDTLI